MVSYAKLLNDTVRVQRWRDLLVRSNPGGVWGLTEYNYRGIALIPKQPRQALAFFDSLWTAVGPVHPGITIFGFSAAQAANDSAALETWFHRTLASGHADSIQTASMMLRVPSLADEALGLLRAALVTTEAAADGRRDLELSRTAARSAEEDRRARTLDALGNALITRGRLRAGVDTLALAATIGWSPPRYRTVAAKALTLGDTVQAIEAFAHVAADPATVASFADSVRTLVGPRFDAQSWKQLVSGATAEMKRRMLARAERTALPNVSITDARARSRRLSELVDGRPTLVAFWSMYCFYSLAQHAELAATAHRLATLGYNTVAITNGRLDSATLDTLAAHKWDFPPYRDGNNEARVAFAQFGTPEYFVLDGKGRVRFRLTTLANAPAQLVSVDDR
jgi:hypothetical protein